MTRTITVEQAAERLQVRPNTIRTWIKQGRIPGRKIGRVYRIPEQALDALIRRLRDRLASVDPSHTYIITVRGHGLRLDNPLLED